MSPDDHFRALDPIRRAYRAYWTRAIAMLFVVLCLAGFVVGVGVPHVQWSYELYSPRGPESFPRATDKRCATYLSVTGRKLVFDGDYSNGCPGLLVIPLADCVALPSWWPDFLLNRPDNNPK